MPSKVQKKDNALAELTPEKAKDDELFIRIAGGLIQAYVKGKDLEPSSHYFCATYEGDLTATALVELYYEEEFLRYPYRSSTIYVDEYAPYLLSPNELALKQVNDRLSFVPLVSSCEKEVFTDPIPNSGISLQWVTSQEVYDFCMRSFPNLRITHPVLPFVTFSIEYTSTKYPKAVVLFRTLGRVNIIFCDEGRVKLCNGYDARTEEEVVYYVTAIWKKFHLARHKDHLLLFTGAEIGDELKTLPQSLSNSVRHTYHNEFSNLVETPQEQEVGSVPPEFFLSSLCEL